MKLFAQCGYGLGSKVSDGADKGILDGAIISPKDMNPTKVGSFLSSCSKDFEALCDPQFYVSLYGANENLNPGKLEDWGLLDFCRRSDLELSDKVGDVIKRTNDIVLEKGFSNLITPNIYITKSFDSLEAAVSKNFIRLAKEGLSDTKVYATLAFSKEALLQKEEVDDFLTSITAMDTPPDGFYLLVGSSDIDSTDFYHQQIFANWLLLNFTLSVNGFDVINGYSDIFSPFLGAVGGYAGASGWWSNLQSFSMRRFMPTGTGGRRPVTRYLCDSILTRVKHTELRNINQLMPNSFLSNTEFDITYLTDPDGLNDTVQILQYWTTLKSIIGRFDSDDIDKNLESAINHINSGKSLLSQLSRFGYNVFPHDLLDELTDGINRFMKIAELD